MILHNHDNMNIVQLSIKRTFDIIASILGMIILSPVYIILAIFVRTKGKGRGIVSQEYIGLNGKPFNLYTFRDIRYLARLPQLWNILRGDMSFVGPCPQNQRTIDEISQRTSDYDIILQTRPGLVSESCHYTGCTDDRLLDRLNLDIRYLNHRTLRLDLSILVDVII